MKDSILLICIIILLVIIYLLNNKNLTLEKFTNSPPLLYNANNEKQLYSLQNIYPKYGSNKYEVGNYSDVILPGEVIGCGSRREPCYGGSQQVIGNILPPLDISNENIAPINGNIGPYPPFQQVGYLYKIFASYEDNSYRPLYLERIRENTKFPIYNYFTVDTEGEKFRVIIPSKYRELGTNDQVQIDGEDCFFRVTINQTNFPSYPRVSKL